jgi:hypothetical protein
MAANAIGQHKQMSAQEKADAARKAAIKSVVDENYAANKAYQESISGNLASIMAGASGPQTTSSSNWSNSESDTLQEMDFGPEGNAAAGDVLMAARNQPWTVQNALAGMRAGMERNLAGAGRSMNTAINNRAAKMGVDPGLMKIGADQGLNAQRLANEQGIVEKGMDLTRQAYGDIQGVLKNLFQKNKTHQTQKQRGGGTTTGGPDYGTMLAAMRAGGPVQREVVV